jgi:hypothetical protein
LSILTYSQRQHHWEWCREFIDREVIYRAGEREGGGTYPQIPGKATGSSYVWQFYLRRATFHPEFAHRLGLLFCRCSPSSRQSRSVVMPCYAVIFSKRPECC